MSDDDDSGVFRRFEKAPPDFEMFGVEAGERLWAANYPARPLTYDDIVRALQLSTKPVKPLMTTDALRAEVHRRAEETSDE